LVKIVVEVINVSWKWVAGITQMAITCVLTCLGMNTFEELMLAYWTRLSISNKWIRV